MNSWLPEPMLLTSTPKGKHMTQATGRKEEGKEITRG